MPGTTYKPLGAEISIASANTVANSGLIRIINTSGSTQVLHLANTGGEYANISIINGQEAVIKKQNQDTVQMTGGLSVPIGYSY